MACSDGPQRCFPHRQDLANRAEAEIIQQSPEPFFRLFEIPIVSELRKPTTGEARLLRIDLPGMQVKDSRLALAPVQAVDASARPSIREQPEVAAAADRKVQPTDANR
jgi:hypothetical protein